MRKTPLRPGRGFSRRRQPVKSRNAKRRASEFARCYHSRARVKFVKSLPCVWCGWVGASENAHTETGGAGYKAGYETIVPLCGDFAGGCHSDFDQYCSLFAFAKYRDQVKAHAPRIEALWRAHVGQVHGTPTQGAA